MKEERARISTTSSKQDDERFVREYDDFVRSVAAQTRRQLGVDCSMEDLVGFGFAGLLEARNRFDASKGIAFRAFAYYRVRGAVLDGVRTMAYLPRRAYARMKAAEAADYVAESHDQARASKPEVRSDTASRLRAIDGVLGQMAASYSVACMAEDGDEEASVAPDKALLRKQRRALLAAAIEELPEREAHMVRGHYLQGRRLDELAAELGLSKSWGSRLHAKALTRLRERLREG